MVMEFTLITGLAVGLVLGLSAGRAARELLQLGALLVLIAGAWVMLTDRGQEFLPLLTQVLMWVKVNPGFLLGSLGGLAVGVRLIDHL